MTPSPFLVSRQNFDAASCEKPQSLVFFSGQKTFGPARFQNVRATYVQRALRENLTKKPTDV